MGVVLSDGEHDHESLHSGPFVSPSVFVSLMSGFANSLCEFAVLSMAVGWGKKAALVPKACKPWQPFTLVNR